MGLCYDMPGCKMPECCSVKSGTFTNISLTYIASTPMTTGTTHGYLVGLGVGPSEKQLSLPIPVTQVPNLAVPYDYNFLYIILMNGPRDLSFHRTFQITFKYVTCCS